MPGGYFFCSQKIGAAGEALISDLKRINHRVLAPELVAAAADQLLAGDNLNEPELGALKGLRLDQLSYATVREVYPDAGEFFARMTVSGRTIEEALTAKSVNLSLLLRPLNIKAMISAEDLCLDLPGQCDATKR